MRLEFGFPVLFAWDEYFRCWSWPKRLTFMRFHVETAELQAVISVTVISAIHLVRAAHNPPPPPQPQPPNN